MATIDVYDYDKKITKAKERFENNKKILQKNKELILDFIDNNCIDLSKARILFYIDRLSKIGLWFGKLSFLYANKKDINKIRKTINQYQMPLNQKGYTENTKKDYNITLKLFFKWLRINKGYPKNWADPNLTKKEVKRLQGTKIKNLKGIYPQEVEEISTTIKNNNHKIPEEILTEKEVKKLIEHSENERNRILIALLYESGCRVGELLTLKRKNASFDEIGARIVVNGKTGMRTIRLISSVSYLLKWYNGLSNDPEKPLFPNLTYKVLEKMLKKIAKKCEIKKAVNPHAFRHARATFLANKLTDAQLKDFFGWTQSSRMASVYIHLSGRDTDEAIQKIYGTLEKKQEKKSILSPLVCPRCDAKNESTNKYCSKCWLPLDVKTAMEQKEMQEQSFRVLDKAQDKGIRLTRGELKKVIKEMLIKGELPIKLGERKK